MTPRAVRKKIPLLLTPVKERESQSRGGVEKAARSRPRKVEKEGEGNIPVLRRGKAPPSPGSRRKVLPQGAEKRGGEGGRAPLQYRGWGGKTTTDALQNRTALFPRRTHNSDAVAQGEGSIREGARDAPYRGGRSELLLRKGRRREHWPAIIEPVRKAQKGGRLISPTSKARLRRRRGAFR